MEQRGQREPSRRTRTDQAKGRLATRQRLPQAEACPRQNHGAVARHTVNSTPWANGNSPEKLTVFVARRM
jgi:hypothetical protein